MATEGALSGVGHRVDARGGVAPEACLGSVSLRAGDGSGAVRRLTGYDQYTLLL